MNKYVINHKDGNLKNNDAKNLEYIHVCTNKAVETKKKKK